MKFSRRLGKGSERSKGFLLVQPPRRNTPETVETLRADAFQTHVEPELPVLFRVTLKLTGSPADAEDLIQKTLIRPSGRSTGSTANMSRLSRARDRVRAHLRAHTSSFGRTP